MVSSDSAGSGSLGLYLEKYFPEMVETIPAMLYGANAWIVKQ